MEKIFPLDIVSIMKEFFCLDIGVGGHLNGHVGQVLLVYSIHRILKTGYILNPDTYYRTATSHTTVKKEQ